MCVDGVKPDEQEYLHTKNAPTNRENEREERLPLTFPPKILVLSFQVKGIRIAFYLIKKAC
ncbi:hypothetical protein R950_003861 [Salmonella enterica subsp. enterica]|nr:hypothetical protein [Salmonella enterica subsp. houtenae serovar 44:z4,z23:-]EBX5568526.1 hypothetical protein [Salmonella enterica subsp. enterica serovar Kuessel]ECA1326887.1 hypothetical protein [Salmonella enterica subsp. enterica serovar Leatherhead]ECF3155607.1 hypothetical protein [Salmonella enterica subsp. enterica serovar Volkmarsdorf]ECI5563710.1 hypothetical protein [Salmonella enterica subsp. enterica]EDW2261814.1 hypothetical protein [Salmonella enterica subsp. enterica serov